jgi:hypothetical protein
MPGFAPAGESLFESTKSDIKNDRAFESPLKIKSLRRRQLFKTKRRRLPSLASNSWRLKTSNFQFLSARLKGEAKALEW